MKKILICVLIICASNAVACGPGGDWYGMGFYNLFKQTNITATEFYPFLRDEYNAFFEEEASNNVIRYPEGNINLWKEILVGWSTEDIEEAVYKENRFDWDGKNSSIEKQAKIYLDFAWECSNAVEFRNKRNSWSYNDQEDEEIIDTEALISKANLLLSNEQNEQLIARYYYQIVRILHYSEEWDDAVRFYETRIENRLVKNEIYYYISDQVAGCYYSTENYDKAAYLFTKIVNHSTDRKKSAFSSFNMCTKRDAEGKPYFEGIEDEKDLLLIKSLRDFSANNDKLDQFIALDANDERIELLFMRDLNRLESDIWPQTIGSGDKTLPYYDDNKNIVKLLEIAEQQAENKDVKNTDFWRMASSYISFINKDIVTAKQKLELVHSFSEQKKALSVAYTIFSWESLTSENEKYLIEVLNDYPQHENYYSSENELRYFVLDKVANTYYKNGQIAKAFLVHNKLEEVNNINSIKLLNALETLYHKQGKSEYETMLIGKVSDQYSFIDYVNYQKGIYYLYHQNPEQAALCFSKNKSVPEQVIPAFVFSNNTMECFSCMPTTVMSDEVYKADVFSFITNTFSIKELANNIMELEKLRTDEVKWKAKLANYLLANYYYNISNTGYYRGRLGGNGNYGDGHYIAYANDTYKTKQTAEALIDNTKGYNLYNVSNSAYERHYFGLSDVAMNYYQNVLDLSTDKELNARCLFLMAKCELNDYYNNGSTNTFRLVENKYFPVDLPMYNSLKILKEEYSDTKFQRMIIKECSYYNSYSNELDGK